MRSDLKHLDGTQRTLVLCLVEINVCSMILMVDAAPVPSWQNMMHEGATDLYR